MMSLLSVCQWLEETQVGTAIREGAWEYSVLNLVHMLGLALAAGTIVFFDLRLLGLGLRRAPVSAISRYLLPLTWVGFFVMFVTGTLLITSEATRLYANLAFRIKLALLLLAGANVLTFHVTVYRRVAVWDRAVVAPLQARLAGGVSITLWLGMLAAGRLIGYTLN